MKLNFFVAGTHQMIDNMGRGRVATGTAEPFATSQASNDRARVVNTAVTGFVSYGSSSMAGRTYAQACGGNSFSSSGLPTCFPFTPSTGMLTMLSVSSSSNASVPSSSSS